MPIPDVCAAGREGLGLWPRGRATLVCPKCPGSSHPGPELETGRLSTEKLLFLFLVALLVPYFTAPMNGILLLKHYEMPGPVLRAVLGEFSFR